MTRYGSSLDKIVENSSNLNQVRRIDLQFGDWFMITTMNSVYLIHVLENETFLISGGWFDQHGLPQTILKINGCTWGGSVIKVDIIAADGLCLEFSNHVVTSPIQKIKVLQHGGKN